MVVGYNVDERCFQSRRRPGRRTLAGTVKMRIVGRALQVVALAGLPLAIPLQLFQVIDLRAMLAIMIGSICLFYIGRIVEGYARG